MANTNSGSGSARRIMAMSSSLDQQQQQQQQQQQVQHHPQQQQPSSRRSSAINFDQMVGQQQYVVAAAVGQQQQLSGVLSQPTKQQQQVVYAAAGQQLVASDEQLHQYQKQIRRNSAHQQQQIGLDGSLAAVAPVAANHYYRLALPADQVLGPQPAGGAGQVVVTGGGAGGLEPQAAGPQAVLATATGPQPTGPTSSKQNNAPQYHQNQQQPAASASAAGSSAGSRRSSLTQPITKAPYIKDDVDIVFNRLMALEAFRKLHPSVIRNLCSYAFIERIDKGVIVFRQGDDAINWYALLEGSVDVKVSQSGGQKDGVTLCTLGVGTTFGASVTPGKSHSVSVVTSDDCTLLRVRRADFQEIFNEQSHLINNVESSPFCSFTSLNRITASDSIYKRALRNQAPAPHIHQQQPQSNGAQQRQQLHQQHQSYQRRGSQQQQQPPTPLGQSSGRPSVTTSSVLRASEAPDEQSTEQQQQEDDLGDLNLDSIDSNELSSHLMRIGWVLRTLILAKCPQMIQNRRIHAHQMHRHHQARQLQAHRAHHHGSSSSSGKQLTSAGSSLQLFAGSSAASNTKSAGRKVANYVASSFMRTNSRLAGSSSKAAAAASATAHGSSGGGGHTAPSTPLFISNSFDADLMPHAAAAAAGGSGSHASSSSSSVGGGGGGGGRQAQAAAATLSLSEPALFRRCMLGREMVDWLLELSQANTSSARFVTSRLQAISMWQVLLEQGIVFAFADSTSDSAAGGGGGELASASAATADSPASSFAAATTTTTVAPDSSRAAAAAAAVAAVAAAANCCQFQFCDDSQAYYKFWFDREGTKQTESSQLPQRPTESDLSLANESLWWSLKVLSKLAPDACFRLILSKRPHERSHEEVDIVYEELQHLKALSHLSNSVKKELAACVTSEHHAKQNTVIFNQGDPGHSWYIILRGSVNVVIVGKGVVCTLHDGDDFGKLALVNDAPRAATIVTNEPNCYFLRVDKHDFNTILRDVEANTVRLKEHGKEVLILQKVPAAESSGPAASSGSGGDQSAAMAASAAATASSVAQQNASAATAGPTASATAATGATPAATQTGMASSALKYMVMAGTGEKMLEHLLETRIDGHTQIGPLLTGRSSLIQHDQVSSYIQCQGDNFLEDFILTHKIFMPTANLCNELLKQYQCQTKSQLASAAAATSGRRSSLVAGEEGAAASGAGSGGGSGLDDEYLVAKKRRVVKFVRCWMLITREHFFQQQRIQSFLTTIHQKVKQDAASFSSLQPELKAIARILELHLEEDLESRHKGVQRWIDDIYGNILPIRRHSGAWELSQSGGSAHASELFLASLHQRRFEHKLSTIQADDEIVFRVYCADHSYTTLKTRVDEKAGEVKQMAARKLNLLDKELILVHVKSNGERIIYNDLEFNISTSLSVNGRVFVCPLDHIDAISPLPEQDPFQEVYQSLVSSTTSAVTSADQQQPAGGDTSAGGGGQLATGGVGQQQQQLRESAGGVNQNSGSGAEQQQQQANNSATAPIVSHLLAITPTNYADIKAQMSLSVNRLEEFSSRDVAYCLTHLAWSLLKNMHEFELIYTVFGRHNFKQITANLNVFLRHFNEIQYWVVTQICLSSSLSKRVQIMRKFIKIAAHCKELQNLNAFFAIIMGLSNMAVARLTQTWERLPSKLKRTFSQFESLIDPSRNHRRYRIFISKMEPPIIPFMPLLLKDMTFAHEGNKTYLENGLINFEKMQMVAQTLRTIRYCKSRPMKLDSSACKFKGSIRSIELFFRDLKIIDNQRTLTQMSHQLEHRKT